MPRLGLRIRGAAAFQLPDVSEALRQAGYDSSRHAHSERSPY